MVQVVEFPTSLSPSRSNDFLTCPLLYRYRTIDNLPETPSAAAVQGTLVHRVLEELFGQPSGARTVEYARTLLEQGFAELEQERPEHARILAEAAVDPTKILAPAEPLLETYFRLEDPNRLEPHSRELGIAAEVTPGFVIRGFVDRIDEALNGSIRIVDYKTGRAPGPQFEAKAMFQMRFYALTWWRMTGAVPTQLQLMYLGSAEILRYQPDEVELLATERKILAIRQAISQAAEREDFRPTPSRLCSWCSFSQHCPAFDGTLLPFPERQAWQSGSIPGNEQSTMLKAHLPPS
jgi:putative RecB family exonuclease